MNETVRFHVVGAIWAQADPEPCRDPLLDLLGDEESVRCRAAILDGFAEREWALPEDRRPSLQPQLPDGYVLDNDGTLWTEKPGYTQFGFLVAELRAAVADDHGLADRSEYAAVLSGDAARIGALGVARVAGALVEVLAARTPEWFEQRVREFMHTEHPSGRPYSATTYQPMLELLDALRVAGITPFIVTGGGTDFVRAVSEELYAIPPWHVVGSTIMHEVIEGHDGAPRLQRTATLLGEANEGDTKVANLQLHLGVRPVLAAGNSAGDARMLEYTTAGDGGLAVLVDHDDADREYAYVSEAATIEAEPVLDTAAREGWTVVSMRNDWTTVFGD